MRGALLHTVVTLALCAALPVAAQDASEAPRLRVRNASDQPFARLTLIFPHQRVAFTNLAPGATSAYQGVPSGVYAYAAIEYQVPGQEPVLQAVTDWTGERPLPGVSFTFLIRYDGSLSVWERIKTSVATDLP